MMTPHERLVYMANQIARNFAAQGADVAARATADHITAFWNPTMKAEILTQNNGLEPIAARAVALLQVQASTPFQTAGQGGSDAG